jgi:hypothetical protein
MATRTGRPRPKPFPWGRIASWVVGVPLVVATTTMLGFAVLRGNPQWFVAFAERLMPRTPVETFATDTPEGRELFFRYGAIGNEAADGLPLKVWRELPELCSHLLPPGAPKDYTAFGFTFDKTRAPHLADTPIGLSRTRLGPPFAPIEVLAINCATCHVQTYTVPGDRSPEPRIFVGGANNRLDAQAYTRFVAACAETDAFEPATMIAAMDRRQPLALWERVMYRHLVIPVAKKLIQQRLGARFHWTWSRPPWGPGRLSPFNPVKFDYLAQPVDTTIDHGDVMPAWNARAKQKIRPDEPTLWHWDGLSADLREVVLNSALGDGMTRFGYRKDTIDTLMAYLDELKSPSAPVTPDPALIDAGRRLFEAQCASCHAATGKDVMRIIPIDEIKTDRSRLDMWTPEAAAAYNNYDKGGWRPQVPWYARWFDAGLDWWKGRPSGFPWEFRTFDKRNGYLAQTLEGIWLTGPYLHNGSVPTLDDLLKPATQRPRAFVRGLDRMDFVRGGYVSPECEPGRHSGTGFCYDTTLRGNGNGGHEYGTGLTPDERRALVQYLLTL